MLPTLCTIASPHYSSAEARSFARTQHPMIVDGQRLWETIMASARIGPGRTPTGLRRLALTDADREMRDLFARWCREVGCAVTVDRMGNMFARRPGSTTRCPRC